MCDHHGFWLGGMRLAQQRDYAVFKAFRRSRVVVELRASEALFAITILKASTRPRDSEILKLAEARGGLSATARRPPPRGGGGGGPARPNLDRAKDLT